MHDDIGQRGANARTPSCKSDYITLMECRARWDKTRRACSGRAARPLFSYFTLQDLTFSQARGVANGHERGHLVVSDAAALEVR